MIALDALERKQKEAERRVLYLHSTDPSFEPSIHDLVQTVTEMNELLQALTNEIIDLREYAHSHRNA